MVFTTRAQWQKGYKDVAAQLAGEHKEYTAFIEKHNKTVGKLTTDFQEVEKARDAEIAERKKADARVVAAEGAQKEAEKKAVEKDALFTQADTQVKNLAVEVKKKDDLIADNLKSITELEEKSKKSQEEAVKYKIEAESFKTRNETLVTSLEKVQKELNDLRSDRAARAGQIPVNPPPEDVKGTIKATDPSSGLVTINLGSDSGLTKGNTLHVYRLSPRPQYVGLLRIVDVRPNESVAKLTSAARPGAIQVGDEVASKILDNR